MQVALRGFAILNIGIAQGGAEQVLAIALCRNLDLPRRLPLSRESSIVIVRLVDLEVFCVGRPVQREVQPGELEARLASRLCGCGRGEHCLSEHYTR
jgi:hypothetical protein